MQSSGHAVRDPVAHTIIALATEPQRPAAVEVGCMLIILPTLLYLRAVGARVSANGSTVDCYWDKQ